MNKRIKELYGNALDKAVPYTWHNLDHAEVEKIMKEFAELIVRECASELIRWKDEPFPYDPEFGAKLIRKHFGVEE